MASATLSNRMPTTIRVTAMQRWAISQRAAGLSRRESAEACSVSPQAIKKRFSRARRKILAQIPAEQRRRYLDLMAWRQGTRRRVKPMSFSFLENV